MDIIKSIGDLRKAVRNARSAGRTIGVVPTMGCLHEGHLSLMRRARQENDLVVATVFVNPTQFGPNEDFDAYPRNAQRDIDLMQAENVDIAFLPEADDLYPDGYATYVEVQGPMTRTLCGASRPGHFKGVTTIVAKLFHLTAPHRAYFGQKDAQQVAVIRQMARDLDFDLDVVACPTVREPDGLAMSSRNGNLSKSQRMDAVVISQALFEARDMIAAGETQADKVIDHIHTRIEAVEQADIDYLSVVDFNTLKDLEVLDGSVLIAVAVKFGNTRLIDNLAIDIPTAGRP
jgi:pantoate--beta-alanine ligase